MVEIILKSKNDTGISDVDLKNSLVESVREKAGNLKKVLLIPPDITRMYS
jgi:hypothetical protein